MAPAPGVLVRQKKLGGSGSEQAAVLSTLPPDCTSSTFTLTGLLPTLTAAHRSKSAVSEAVNMNGVAMVVAYAGAPSARVATATVSVPLRTRDVSLASDSIVLFMRTSSVVVRCG